MNWAQEIADNFDDIQIEGYLAELMDFPEILQDILLQPVGTFHRNIRRDVGPILEPGSSQYTTSKYVIQVLRNGLYESLPESLFHQSGGKSGSRTVNDMRKEVGQNRKDQMNTKRFFWPLDHSFLMSKAEVAHFERLSISKLGDLRGANPLQSFWMPEPWLTREQRSMFILLYPIFHRITEKREWVEKAISIITGLPIKVNYLFRQTEIKSDRTPSLGVSHLGIDTVLGQRTTDVFKSAVVTIGPVGVDVLEDLVLKGSRYKALELVSDFVFPCDIAVEYIFEPDENRSALGKDEMTILGINAILSA